MGRGYSNANIPPGLVREIRYLVAKEAFGYKSMNELVKDGARLVVLFVRLVDALEVLANARQPPPLEQMKKVLERMRKV